MIEYALLFALGFLAAALVVMALAPAVHRRIVAYTERRIYATMPISPAEVRAQKDMERAAFAAEAARIGDDLRRERDGRLAAQARAESAVAEAARLASADIDLRNHLEELDVTAAGLRAEIRRVATQNADLRAALNLSHTTIDALRREVDFHDDRARKLETDISGLRIDIAARDTEVENIGTRLQSLRHERDSLRADYNHTSSNFADLERRSGQSQDRLARLEQKSLRQASELADMEDRLERRTREADELRERLREALRRKENDRMTPTSADPGDPDAATGEALLTGLPQTPEAARLEARAHRLMEKVLAMEDAGDNAVLREELADLAAAMTAYAGIAGETGERIREILMASPAYEGHGRISLASRIKTAVAERELGNR